MTKIDIVGAGNLSAEIADAPGSSRVQYLFGSCRDGW